MSFLTKKQVRVTRDMQDKKKRDKWWLDTFSDYPGAGIIYDSDIGDFVRKHTRFIDRFNMRKMAAAVMTSFDILAKIEEEPKTKKKNWKFFKDF